MNGIETYCQTDVGLRRENNQDFVYASDQKVGPLDCLLIVADGMGGHAAGDLASRICVETMVDTIGAAAPKDPVRVLDTAIRAANAAVLKKASSDPALLGMGTTVVAATVRQGVLTVANVGDSRLYVLDDDRIDQITHDHSLVEEMVRAGRLKREQARSHPDKNIITRAIGESEKLEIDYFDVGLHRGDTVLLCSDGLSNMVEDSQMLRIVNRAHSLKEACGKLVDEANRQGGRDNISVVLARETE